MDEYRTLQEVSQGLYKEKGSKFIAIAIPVDSVDEVRLQLEQLRKRYHDARHHCYAYRLGEEPYEVRYNDDREPSGTAGKPIFGQIQSFELTNVLIVIIRYFGGVKLGTGGLIQAYRNAARDAIENGKIVTKTWKALLEIRYDYLQMNDVMRVIKDEGLRIIHQESPGQSCILLEIRKGNLETVIRKFSSLEKLECTVI
ncbi:MAG: YigZ family protein [Bacteroidales bacterium]|nr:YigZ family protein [Bacteroidales bacterium]